MDKTVVVPVEPTEEMLNAGAKALEDNGSDSAFDILVTDAAFAYEAMISAAPAATASASLCLAQQDERSLFDLAASFGRKDMFDFRAPGTSKAHKVECVVMESADVAKFAAALADLCAQDAPQGANNKWGALPFGPERALRQARDALMGPVANGFSRRCAVATIDAVFETLTAQDAQEPLMFKEWMRTVRYKLDQGLPLNYGESLQLQELLLAVQCGSQPGRVTPEMWKTLDDANQQLEHGQRVLDELNARYGLDKQEAVPSMMSDDHYDASGDCPHETCDPANCACVKPEGKPEQQTPSMGDNNE